MPVLSLSDEITDLRLTDAKCMYVLIYFSKFIALSHYEKYIEQTCRFCSYQGSAKFSSSPGIVSGFEFLRLIEIEPFYNEEEKMLHNK